MSYKTSARGMRLGMSHDWNYKAHGPLQNLHLDEGLAQYLGNIVEFTVTQAPQRAKTKGRYLRKFAVKPGLQGKTRVLRSQENIHAFVFFYLDLDGASDGQLQRMQQCLRQVRKTLHRESGYDVHLHMMNYFIFFWRYTMLLGRRGPRRAKRKINRCVGAHRHLQMERAQYTLAAQRLLRLTRRRVRRWRRERYFQRTFHPILSAFIFRDFDAEIVVKAIAMELQILRIYHRRFLRYIQKLVAVAISYSAAEERWLDALEVQIRGRLTNFRRQIRRSGIKTMRFGEKRVKKSDLRRENGHCAAIAYNRYGVISVQMTYQLRSQLNCHWSEESYLRPERFFSLESYLETLHMVEDSGPRTAEEELRRRNPSFVPRGELASYQLQSLQRSALAPGPGEHVPLTRETLDWDRNRRRWMLHIRRTEIPVSFHGVLHRFFRSARRAAAGHAGRHLCHPTSDLGAFRRQYTNGEQGKGKLLPLLWEQHTLVPFLQQRLRPRAS